MIYVDKQVSGSRPSHYAYDPIGNRLSSSAATNRTYSSNELNQYSAITGQSSVPKYDADGNQTQSASACVYKWNAENRLGLRTEPNTKYKEAGLCANL